MSEMKPSKQSIKEALEFISCILEAGDFAHNIGPSTMGGIGITQWFGDNECCIEFRNSGETVMTKVFPDGNFRVVIAEPGCDIPKMLAEDLAS